MRTRSSSSAGVERRRAHGERAVAAAREHQQVLGELREPVALVDGGPQRLAQVRVGRRAAQRALQLGLDHRDRRAQLVAGVGDEAPLAVVGAAQPVEHLVERLAEPADLVARGGERERLRGRLERDAGGAGAHPLDRPQARRRERVAEQRHDERRDRRAERERARQRRERLVAVVERLAHDDHRRAVALGEQPRRAVDAVDLALGLDIVGRRARASSARVSTEPSAPPVRSSTRPSGASSWAKPSSSSPGEPAAARPEAATAAARASSAVSTLSSRSSASRR